jgi:hypothetical protein
MNEKFMAMRYGRIQHTKLPKGYEMFRDKEDDKKSLSMTAQASCGLARI